MPCLARVYLERIILNCFQVPLRRYANLTHLGKREAVIMGHEARDPSSVGLSGQRDRNGISLRLAFSLGID
jgi:hypothetical protein